MKNNIGNVRGMRDLLDTDSRTKNDIEVVARYLADKYGYQEINTPIVEYTSVFNKSLGESSEIISKEMYNFEDEKGRSLSLRPEATAGIARAIVSNGLLGSGEYRIPLKFFLFGPMFRYERPQKGRYRQFYQINFEAFSNLSPENDVELISLANNFLKLSTISTSLVINSLGDKKTRSNFKDELVLYLNKFKNDLTEDSKKRLKINPLRILDTKNNNDLKIISGAPKMINFLSKSSKDYYNSVKKLLNDLGIKFKEDSNLVRGLDYYKETVFEFKTDKLGQQQDTVLGGGRYSGLVKMFGGSDVEGVGWASGTDRLIEISEKNNKVIPKVSIVYDEQYKKNAFLLSDKLRNEKKIKGYVDINFDISANKQLKKANKINSENIIFIEDTNRVKISNRKSKKDNFFSFDEIDKIINFLDGY